MFPRASCVRVEVLLRDNASELGTSGAADQDSRASSRLPNVSICSETSLANALTASVSPEIAEPSSLPEASLSPITASGNVRGTSRSPAAHRNSRLVAISSPVICCCTLSSLVNSVNMVKLGWLMKETLALTFAVS